MATPLPGKRSINKALNFLPHANWTETEITQVPLCVMS